MLWLQSLKVNMMIAPVVLILLCSTAKATLSYRPRKPTTQIFQMTVNNMDPINEKMTQDIVSIFLTCSISTG